jgi:hypothetical protein
MLLIGPGAGDDLLRHWPWRALPAAALQRECLVTAGLWRTAVFLAHAASAVPPDAHLPGHDRPVPPNRPGRHWR